MRTDANLAPNRFGNTSSFGSITEVATPERETHLSARGSFQRPFSKRRRDALGVIHEGVSLRNKPELKGHL